jgi:CBS domain-containing protein
MATAREMMHPGAECIKSDETIDVASRRMRDLDVGALPICGPEDRLVGILTDRDIVVKCIAEGKDPTKSTAMDLAQGTPKWVDANASEEDVLTAMAQYRIKRMPVIQDHRLVGMISESDLARHLSEEKVGHFVEAVYGRA